VNQQPQAGRVTMPSAPVVLYYAMNDPNVVSVPNVKGMSVQQAYEALSNVGLELKGPWISIVNDPNLPQGVLEQQPTGFAIRGTPSYLVVNGADGNLVTPSIDLGVPQATVIGPDGQPIPNPQPNIVQAIDAFGNPIPNQVAGGPRIQVTGNSGGPRPVPLPSFIQPISQFPTMQADGTVAVNGTGATNGQNANPIPSTTQGFANEFQRNLEQNTQIASGQQPFPQQASNLRGLNIQPANPQVAQQALSQQQGVVQQGIGPQGFARPQDFTESQGVADAQGVGPTPNVQIGITDNASITLSQNIQSQNIQSQNRQLGNNQFDVQARPQGVQQVAPQQPLVQQPVPQQPVPMAPPPAISQQGDQAASGASVRNIPINFNPQNYGFIQTTQNEYRVIVIDDQGERELIRRNLGPDDVVNTMITMYGSGEIQTYVNGSLFQAWSP